jgi:hypothetical protein
LGQGGDWRGTAPAARPGGRRGLCASEVRAAPTNWGWLGARVGAGKGGGQLVLVRGRPELVARRGGHLWRHGWRAGGGARLGAMQRGSAPLWQPRIDGDVPRCTRRPREERMAGGHGTDRWSVGCSPAGRCAARGGGGLRGGLGARVAWGRAASGRGRAQMPRRGTSCRPGKILQCPCLNASNSKKLNRSAQNNE